MREFKLFIYGNIAILLVLAVIGGVIIANISKEKVPEFTFNSSLVEGWNSTGNTNSRELSKNEENPQTPLDELPVANMNVFHGEIGSNVGDNCFLMYGYYDFPLDDIEAKYSEYEQGKDSFGDEIRVVSDTTQKIRTFDGEKEFKLKQYEFITSSEAMRGYQIGYATMSNGYIRIEGVCKTAEDLVGTLKVLETVELKL